MAEKKYRYRMTHPDHRPEIVIGSNRLEAVQKAARMWGVPWSAVARDCHFEILEDAPAAKRAAVTAMGE